MAFRPSLKKKRHFEEAEANLTPVMNLICVLIPLLLSTAKFVDLALLEYLPPVLQESDQEAGGGAGEGGGAENLLELRVNVAYDALEISVFNAVEGENYASIPLRTDGAYDFAEFRAKLADIKERIVGPPVSESQEINPETGQVELVKVYKYADADQVRISAEGDVPLQTIIKVLDYSREYKDENGIFKPLFPAPALGQFQ